LKTFKPIIDADAEIVEEVKPMKIAKKNTIN